MNLLKVLLNSDVKKQKSIKKMSGWVCDHCGEYNESYHSECQSCGYEYDY